MFCLFKYFYPSHSPLGFVISVSFSVLCNSSVNSVDLWTLWEKEMFSPFLVYYLINNYSFLSRQLVQIFVHPKSWQRYLELFYPFFKLPFSYSSHPLLLFPLLFCLLFKQPFSYPSHPLLLFPLLFCLLFKQPFSYPFHPLLLFPLLFCPLFILPFSYPFHPLLLFPLLFCLFFELPFSYPSHPLQLFLLLFCLLFILSLTPPHNHRYCSLCYSVFFYPLSHLPYSTIVTVPSVTLSPLTLSLFHFFVALSLRCFSLLFLVYESIFSSSVDLIFLLYSVPFVYYKTIYLCLYLYIFSCYYLSI